MHACVLATQLSPHALPCLQTLQQVSAVQPLSRRVTANRIVCSFIISVDFFLLTRRIEWVYISVVPYKSPCAI